MLKINRISTGALLLLLTSSAYALHDATSIYLEGKFGYSWAKASDIKKKASSSNIDINQSSFSDGSFLVGGSAGIQFNTFDFPFRIEAEYMQRDHLSFNPGITSSGFVLPYKTEITSRTVLGNIFVDFPLREQFSAFIGAGAGVAFNNTDDKLSFNNILISDSVANRYAFSWMASAGAALQATSWLTITASYRYSDLGDLRFRSDTTNTFDEYNTHNFYANEAMLGIRLTAPQK